MTTERSGTVRASPSARVSARPARRTPPTPLIATMPAVEPTRTPRVDPADLEPRDRDDATAIETNERADDELFTDAFGEAPAFLADREGAPESAREAERAEVGLVAPTPAVEVYEDRSTIAPIPPPSVVAGPETPLDDAPLYAVEETIDRLLADTRSLGADPTARRRVAEAFAEIAGKLGGEIPEASTPGLLGQARGLFRSDYYERQWGPRAMRERGEDIDPFGLDRSYEARMRPLFEALYRRWFRVTTRDISNLPTDGRAMVVANRAGALPWDGLMLKTAVALEHPARRELRWLVEDYVFHAPFLGAITNRLGAVRACPENAERLLEADALLAVFPEGDKGVAKPFARRYELQRFGRGGYVRLALRTRTPIVPTAIVGAEEAHPMLFPTSRLAKLVGVPFLPVTATFPWLGPLGLVPLPSRWVIWVGEPIDLSREAPGAEDDPLAVQRISEEVRGAVSTLLRRALALRPSPF